MIVLFDTDVVLDLILDLKPFSEAAVQLFSKVEADEINGFVSATTITTIHYLATKTIGAKKAKSAIRTLLSILDVAPVDRPVLERALEGKYKDFKDGVLVEAARQVEAKAIITRNINNFKKSIIPTYSPSEMLKALRIV
jgi:predicted nucleic acid-binding protein